MGKSEILEEFRKRFRKISLESCERYNLENPHSQPIPIYDTEIQDLVRDITNKKGLEKFLQKTEGQPMVIIKSPNYQAITEIRSSWIANFQTDENTRYTIAILKEDPTKEDIESIFNFYKKNIETGEVMIITKTRGCHKTIW